MQGLGSYRGYLKYVCVCEYFYTSVVMPLVCVEIQIKCKGEFYFSISSQRPFT